MTTLKRLRGILVRDFRLDARMLKSNAPLDRLGIDAVGLMDLMFTVEEEFKLTVPVNAVELETLLDIASYIDELLLAHYGTDPSAVPEPAASAATSTKAEGQRKLAPTQEGELLPRRRCG